MNNRYLGALVLAPFIIFLFIGGLFLKYGIMVLALFGLYEFYKVIKEKQINAVKFVGYFMCIIYYTLFIPKDIAFKEVFLFIIFMTLILLCLPVLNIKYTFIDVACTILGFLYVAVFFSFIPLVNAKENGNLLIWLIFISSWLCDTSAYYVGRAFGKNKLCPKISPKKTIEGSIGGLIGSSIACLILGYFINVYSFGVYIPLYHYLIIGLICGVFCQLGDLIASSIKRYVGVKDYSNLIPGHGGILDRFDSILFSSVIVYFYLTFILNK